MLTLFEPVVSPVASVPPQNPRIAELVGRTRSIELGATIVPQQAPPVIEEPRGEKVCTRCGWVKPLSAFHPFSRNKEKRDAHCKECQSIKSKEAYARRANGTDKRKKPNAPMPVDGMKLCTNCEQTKPVDRFNVSKVNKSGLTSHCKECHNEKLRESYRTNGGHAKMKANHFKNTYGITKTGVRPLFSNTGI